MIGQLAPSAPAIGTIGALTGHMPRLVTIKTNILLRALSGYVAILLANIAGHRLTSVPDLAAEPINHKGQRDVGREDHSNYPGTCVDTLKANP